MKLSAQTFFIVLYSTGANETCLQSEAVTRSTADKALHHRLSDCCDVYSPPFLTCNSILQRSHIPNYSAPNFGLKPRESRHIDSRLLPYRGHEVLSWELCLGAGMGLVSADDDAGG
jgi:hypothetical protein